MAAVGPGDWLNRIADSLAEHEERRSSLQEGPPRYEILGEISRGGMGIVYRAWDPTLGRDVALKVLQAEDGNSAEAHERFQREARLAAALHHPNIVPVYDTGIWNGQDYIAMQLIEGTTLDKAGLDLRGALACIRDAARALGEAHRQGIVHRDVKPSNLLIDRQGRVFVTDFGVARQSQVSASMTSPGTVVGTPAYMSPEQSMGLPTDARSDVYSIGATIYEMATGRPPYVGRDPVEVVLKVQAGELDTPRRLSPELSQNVEAIILGAMERTREDRYASATELADDIDRYLQGERPLRRPRGTAYRIRRQFVRHPWRSVGSIVFCILLILAGTALGYWIRGRIYWNRAQNEKDPELKKAHLRKAAFWVPAADAKLAQLVSEELEREKEAFRAEAERARQKQEAKDEAQRIAKQLEEEERLRKLREANDEKERERGISETYIAAMKSISDRALPEARRWMEALRLAARPKFDELLPKLREVEFDLGVQELDRLASKSEVVPFGKLHAELSGETYASQKDRNAKLARPAFALGRKLFEQGRWTESVKWCDASEELGLREAGLYEKRGLALVELKQWDLAERDFNRLLGFLPAGTPLAPKFGQIAYQKGRALAADRRYVEALKEFEVSLRIDPALAPAYHDRGLARHAAHGLSREALEQDLGAALGLDPALKPAREYRNVALALARSEGARLWGVEAAANRTESLNRVIFWLGLMLDKVSPDDAELLLERAKTRRRLGELPAALLDARASVKAGGKADSQAALAMISYVFAYSQNKNESGLKEALAHFNELERLEPESPRAAYGRGLCRRQLGEKELDAALKDFTAAEKPDRPAPHLSLQIARVLMDRKEWAAASEAAARARSAASRLAEEEYVGGLFEMQRTARTDGIRLITRDASLIRGQAAFELKDYPLSIEECTEAIRLDPRLASAYNWRGYARYQDKRYKEAQEDFKETIRLSAYELEKTNATQWMERCARRLKGD